MNSELTPEDRNLRQTVAWPLTCANNYPAHVAPHVLGSDMTPIINAVFNVLKDAGYTSPVSDLDILVDQRYYREPDNRSDLVWIIIPHPETPKVIDVIDYEATDYRAARNKHGEVKTFRTSKEAVKWAKRHPKRVTKSS